MATPSSGVFKTVAYKAEVTYGTAPASGSAQYLRRVESSLDLSKDTYSSNEIRTDMQIADFRHGVRHVGGNLKAELSPGTYKDFIAAALRKVFASVTPITALSLTLAGSGPTYTLTRSSGWWTDGIKAGDVIRLSVGTLNAANSNKNLLIVALTQTVATVIPLNGVALVAEGPIAGCTVSVTGKKCYVPSSGHTSTSFAIEHWFSDAALSELFTGVKINTLDINLPPTGMGTIDFGLMGQNLTTATAQYFTAPTAASSSGVVAAVNGVLLVNGAAVATCTGLSIKLDGGMSGDPVVGANTVPNIFPGRVKVSGQFTAYFDSGTFRDNFINEDTLSLVVALTTSNAASADFVTFSLPSIKLGGASKTDTEKGIIATFPFTALFNSAGGAGTATEQSTIVIQDSLA